MQLLYMNPLHAFPWSFPRASFRTSPHDTTKADGRRPAVDQDDLQAAVSIYSVLGSCLIGSLLCISWKLPKLGDPLQISVTAVKKQTCTLAVMLASKWNQMAGDSASSPRERWYMGTRSSWRRLAKDWRTDASYCCDTVTAEWLLQLTHSRVSYVSVTLDSGVHLIPCLFPVGGIARGTGYQKAGAIFRISSGFPPHFQTANILQYTSLSSPSNSEVFGSGTNFQSGSHWMFDTNED